KEKIYEQYLKAFTQGVFNYIKENTDPITEETTSRQYFSGGVVANFSSPAIVSPMKINPLDGPTALVPIAASPVGPQSEHTAAALPVGQSAGQESASAYFARREQAIETFRGKYKREIHDVRDELNIRYHSTTFRLTKDDIEKVGRDRFIEDLDAFIQVVDPSISFSARDNKSGSSIRSGRDTAQRAVAVMHDESAYYLNITFGQQQTAMERKIFRMLAFIPSQSSYDHAEIYSKLHFPNTAKYWIDEVRDLLNFGGPELVEAVRADVQTERPVLEYWAGLDRVTYWDRLLFEFREDKSNPAKQSAQALLDLLFPPAANVTTLAASPVAYLTFTFAHDVKRFGNDLQNRIQKIKAAPDLIWEAARMLHMPLGDRTKTAVPDAYVVYTEAKHVLAIFFVSADGNKVDVVRTNGDSDPYFVDRHKSSFLDAAGKDNKYPPTINTIDWPRTTGFIWEEDNDHWAMKLTGGENLYDADWITSNPTWEQIERQIDTLIEAGSYLRQFSAAGIVPPDSTAGLFRTWVSDFPRDISLIPEAQQDRIDRFLRALVVFELAKKLSAIRADVSVLLSGKAIGWDDGDPLIDMALWVVKDKWADLEMDKLIESLPIVRIAEIKPGDFFVYQIEGGICLGLAGDAPIDPEVKSPRLVARVSTSSPVKGRDTINALRQKSGLRLPWRFAGDLGPKATEFLSSPGGIALNGKKMKTDVVTEGQSSPITFDPAVGAQLLRGDFTGMQGIILNVIPIRSVLPILGLKDDPDPADVKKLSKA
ncbi:MAG: hypothetical protein HQL23_06865, partial [Candidatus Omnitrophica bacterium]|nr:hypothetical protein [Candidatus Omnitrophota bacterium]